MMATKNCVLMGVFGAALGVQVNGVAQVVRSAVGATGGDILPTVNAFRSDLGPNNGVGPLGGGGTPGVGRREINWDGVPDSFSSPFAFPGNFFNLPTGSPAGRVRGIGFSTPGTFEVSADSDSDNDGNPGPVPLLFGNRHPDNPADFAAFSAQRIFGLNGTSEMDVTFSLPGSPGTSAGVRGFGSVFTDVEVAGDTVMSYFDAGGNLLYALDVPAFTIPPGAGDSGKSMSFAGLSFDSPVIHRVHIKAGSFDLSLVPFGGGIDAVAMDDFIYGEPAVPEASTIVSTIGLAGLAGLAQWRRYRATRG